MPQICFLPWLCLSFWGLSTCAAYAQDTTLLFQGQNQRQGINSYQYSNQALGGLEWGKQSLRYRAGQDWNYNTAGERRFVRQLNRAHVQHRYALDSSWSLGQLIDVEDFRANQNAFGDYALMGSWRLEQDTFWKNNTKALLGYSLDKRQSFNDHGPYAGFRLQGQWLPKEQDLHLHYRLNADSRWVQPRHQFNYGGRIGLAKEFGQEAFLQMGTAYQRRQVEDYYRDNIRATVSDTTSAFLNFRYQAWRQLVFSSENELNLPTRSFEYRAFVPRSEKLRNTGFDQTALQLLQKVAWKGRKRKVEAGFQVRQRLRDYRAERLARDSLDFLYEQALAQEEARNISEITYGYYVDGRWNFNAKHSLRGKYRSQLLRVNTSSELNTQDRDELLYSGELAYTYRMNRHFSAGLSTSGSYRHIVYIKSEQSAENYTERILRYQPFYRWRTKHIRWDARFNLTSTYNVRDFESQSLKDRSNRIFRVEQEFEWYLNRRYTFLLQFTRRENRIGLLNWSNFSESPLDTTITLDVHPKLKTRALMKKEEVDLALLWGFRYFRRVQRSEAGLAISGVGIRKIYVADIALQLGPSLGIDLKQSRRLNLQTSVALLDYVQFFDYTLTEEPYVGVVKEQEQLNRRQENLLIFFDIQLRYLLQSSN